MNTQLIEQAIEALRIGVREINRLGGAKEAVPLHEAIAALRAARDAQPVRWAKCPETDTPCSTCPTLQIPCEAAQPVVITPVSLKRVPYRMRYGARLHYITEAEFQAFHIGFCCGEQYRNAQPVELTDEARDAARWRQLAEMEAKMVAPRTLAHYIARPDRLDKVIEICSAADRAKQGEQR